MARIDLDRLYTLFNSEASEQDGNFYFVKKYDEKLYNRLCKIERNAVVNLEHSGSELRNALEYFLRTAYLDSAEGKAAYEEKKKCRQILLISCSFLKRTRIWGWTLIQLMWCAALRMSTTM